MGSEYAGLDFWLSSISCHAPGAPIFVVGTHIDEVTKYTIDTEDLKQRFKQIVGFHFVSSKNKEGINQLEKEIIEVTMQQKYIGEKVPEVWLNFEKNVKKESQKMSLVSYDRIIELAEESNMFDKPEILEAVKFLNGN